jgi:hypothetical protein
MQQPGYLAHFLHLVAMVDGSLDRYMGSECQVDECSVLGLHASPLGGRVCPPCLESDLDHMR